MIDFKPALLLPAEPRALLSLPPMPRAQFAFWPTLAMSFDPPKKRENKQAAAFRTWLGRDPETIPPEDRYAYVCEFREAKRSRTWRIDKRRPQLPARSAKISKPMSMGFTPLGVERRTWDRKVHLPMMPKTRAECPTTRPCTFVRCKHHLKLSVDEDTARYIVNGELREKLTKEEVRANPALAALKRDPRNRVALLKDLFPKYEVRTGNDGIERERYVYPGLPLEEMAGTCSLDIADEGTHTLEQVGGFLGIVQERVRQIEEIGVDEIVSIIGRDVVSREEIIRSLEKLGEDWELERLSGEPATVLPVSRQLGPVARDTSARKTSDR